jgi:hypothetical protein
LNIEWTEPPAARRGKTSSKWLKITEELKAKPNQWALIGRVKHASQATVISRTYDVKVISRKGSDGLYDLYGIYGDANVS